MSSMAGPDVEQLVQGFSETNLALSEDDGGQWEVNSEKNKNKSGDSCREPFASLDLNLPRVWDYAYVSCGTQATGSRASSVIKEVPNMKDTANDSDEPQTQWPVLDIFNQHSQETSIWSDRPHGRIGSLPWTVTAQPTVIEEVSNVKDNASQEFEDLVSGDEPQRQWHFPACQDMVVKELMQISEEIQQLKWFNNKLTKQNKHAKVHEESLDIMSKKLRKFAEDNLIVRYRTKMQHELKNRKEEQKNTSNDDHQKSFTYFHNPGLFEQNNTSNDDYQKSFTYFHNPGRFVPGPKPFKPFSNSFEPRTEEVLRLIEMDAYMEERKKLIKERQKKMINLKKMHHEEMIDLEAEFDKSLEQLRNKHGLEDADIGVQLTLSNVVGL